VIPIVVDGETVEVTVISTWQPDRRRSPCGSASSPASVRPSRAWFSRGGRFPPIVASIPLVLLAVVVGVAQYFSLPSATEPRPIWIVLPLIAAVSAAVGLVLAVRGMRFAADAALLLVGVELAVWGFVKRDGLSAAIVPTDAPFWLDRFATAAALVGGIVLAAIALWWLFAVPAQRAATVDRRGRRGQRFHGAVGLTAPGPPVSTSQPSSVTRMVCSNCAVRRPSPVTAVQSSSHTL
jgi:hypothetical protein